MKWLVFAVVAIFVAIVGSIVWGNLRWDRLSRELHAELDAARAPVEPRRFDPAVLEGLPPPVVRYFRTALREGAPMISAVRVSHEGSLSASESETRWLPFTSGQRVIVNRPGFIWDARVSMAPGIKVRVHDAYVAGTGVLRPSLIGAFDLGLLSDRGETARGELMRFLAEAVWYPTALLPGAEPGRGVRWEPVDERSARATLVDGDVRVELVFGFGADGLIETVRADARGRLVSGKLVMTPWEGRFSAYAERDGMRVPLEGEVAWLTPEGRRPYWRGLIRGLTYEFARP